MRFEIGRAQMRQLFEATPEERERIIRLMTVDDMLGWDANFESWAHDSQLPPSGEGWRSWLMMYISISD